MSEKKDATENFPFQTGRTELSEYGEFGLIHHLTKNFEDKHAFTIKGVGDDAAVLDNPGKLNLLTTDLLLEGVHFDLMYMPLKHLGYKSVVVNVSDICAMNGEPRWITLSLGISNRFSVEALEEYYEGVHLACERYNLDLVGGDTSSSVKGMVISVTAMGEASENNVVYRNTANKGDLICVSGDLGAAYLGLQLLEREKQIYLENPNIQPDLGDHKYLVGRQLRPEARIDIIKALNDSGIKPTSMIDLSDGLSSDLMHLCKKSNLGAIIEETEVPVHEKTYEMAVQFNMDPINCALSGGEDYELLMTIDPKDKHTLSQIPDLRIIGQMTDEADEIKLQTKGGNLHDLVASGWKAF